MPDVELTWLLNDEEESQELEDRLATYYKSVASGPMKDYRRIIQGGNKQGQNYYVHVLDGIAILHKLRIAQVIEIDDLEEDLFFTAYTIHDMNKIPPYGGRDVMSSYVNIATPANIEAELTRIDIARFFPDWNEYIEEIRLLMLLHQHDAAPLADLNLSTHRYALPYERLLELGKVMYAIDNLDLSHTLSEKNHKQNALASINAIAERRWRWVTHRLGENRAVFSNLIHNTIVQYLQAQYTRDGRTLLVDLLYYPDGVAYLIPERETFTWSERENRTLAQEVAKSIEQKQAMSLHQLIKPNQLGIRVSQAAIESGASYTDIMHVIRRRVDSKTYAQTRHSEYNQRLRLDIEAAAVHADQGVATMAAALLRQSEPIVPHDQELLQRGELALAYYNVLNDHLKEKLSPEYRSDPWTYVYTQLHLPKENYTFYHQVNHYRRAYFIARDCEEDVDTLFTRMQADVAKMAGETVKRAGDTDYLQAYLSEHLEFQTVGYTRDFSAHLRYYCTARYKQCCLCSSSSPTTKLMDSEVPANIGVQVFSNRLKGGSGEPKRNVCPVCRKQLILEKLTRVAFEKNTSKRKNSKERTVEYTNFYLHLYPYAFFTRSYQDAIYFTLKNIVHEDSQCFFLKREEYYRSWNQQLDQSVNTQMARQVQRDQEKREAAFKASSTKVNGISVPLFSEAIGNTPTLPLNAPGENYTQQFIFALTHALMIADFFGCRVAMSRTPFPLLSSEYMAEHDLVFFVDSVPLPLRWILPTNEYRSLEMYRERQAKDGGTAYIERKNHWQNEQIDEQGCAAYENIARRLATLYRLSQQLHLSPEESEQFLVTAATALANDPFSVYHVVDLAIEKQLKGTPHRNEGRNKNGKEYAGRNKAGARQLLAPEQMAMYLSKRIAPLLAELVME